MYTCNLYVESKIWHNNNTYITRAFLRDASPCLLSLYAEYIMRNTGLEEAQAGIKMAGRNINNLRYADDTTLWQKVKN